MSSGKGRHTSGKTKRAGVGTRAGSGLKRGQGMDEIVRGEMPADPAAEVEARRSDLPADQLPESAAEIRRRRGQS